MKLLMHICCAPCANMPIDALRADGIDLTGCTNERDFDKDDNIPRITWGKYVRQENGRETLGLSIEVNHRLIDGVHLGRFYESLQNKVNELE